eukprot:2159406-Lingulodinium_polyedra.AAC.1
MPCVAALRRRRAWRHNPGNPFRLALVWQRATPRFHGNGNVVSFSEYSPANPKAFGGLDPSLLRAPIWMNNQLRLCVLRQFHLSST